MLEILQPDVIVRTDVRLFLFLTFPAESESFSTRPRHIGR